MNVPENMLLVDKPKGITSFDVIRRLRVELGIRKMGHAGTLDPLASGLMIIGINEGTKKLNDYLKLPKTYEVVVRVGERRSTGDMEGEILEEEIVEKLDAVDVQSALESMVGTLSLPVPIYSAVKRGGVPLYKKARTGKEIAYIPMRDMEVRGFELKNVEVENGRAHILLSWDVASGVYIRSLAEALGRRLGYPATTEDLRRTKIGAFSVVDARKI